MRNRKLALNPLPILCLMALFLVGCSGKINYVAIEDTYGHVRGRHDTYVDADQALSVLERDLYKVTSAKVVEIGDAAKKNWLGGRMADVDDIGGPIIATSDRHDNYVSNDAQLSDLEKRTYLRSTVLLRKVVADAKGEKEADEGPVDDGGGG